MEEDEELNSLYYPSAGEDLRPFVFSKKENLEFIGLDIVNNYTEPNLFIFSDYFPFSRSQFFDSQILHRDDYTSVTIEDYCEIKPTNKYDYNFNKKHVHFEPSLATGKAIFFKARIKSHRVNEEYFKYGIYFFYENVNLIEQLFLKNNFSFTHLIWKRDGSGLGGGTVKLDFIYHVAARCNTKFFFIWDHYLNDQNRIINNKSNPLERCPDEIKEVIKDDEFEFFLDKKLSLKWDIEDIVNFYINTKNAPNNVNET
ncbi:MAG: hypothetical protein WC967_01775 [Balneolaceae bacterium]